MIETTTVQSITTNVEQKKDPRLWQAVQDFKAILVYQMLKSMRATIPRSGLMEESPGKDYFMSMFDEKVAQTIARQQNDSLSEVLYRQLSGEPIIPRKITRQVLQPLPQIKNDEQQKIFKRIQRYQPIITRAAEIYNVDRDLITAVIAQESGGKHDVVSSKGARGLMQLMRETANELGVRNIDDPRDNIMGGTRYLQQLQERFKYNIPLALAAYNAGPGAVIKYNGIPPYSETQNYVKKVIMYYQALKQKK